MGEAARIAANPCRITRCRMLARIVIILSSLSSLSTLSTYRRHHRYHHPSALPIMFFSHSLPNFTLPLALSFSPRPLFFFFFFFNFLIARYLQCQLQRINFSLIITFTTFSLSFILTFALSFSLAPLLSIQTQLSRSFFFYSLFHSLKLTELLLTRATSFTPTLALPHFLARARSPFRALRKRL